MYMSIFCSCLLTLPISGRHWMGGGGGGPCNYNLHLHNETDVLLVCFPPTTLTCRFHRHQRCFQKTPLNHFCVLYLDDALGFLFLSANQYRTAGLAS
jgi:hypothetical protein